jgi:hypothetical protein
MARAALGPPAAGAYIAIPLVGGADVAAGSNATFRYKLPLGMRVVIVSFSVGASSVTTAGGANTIVVGNASDADGYLESASVTAAAVAHDPDGALATIVSSRVIVEPADEIRCLITAPASSGVVGANVVAMGYVLEHADNTNPTDEGLKADMASGDYI